jgi:glycosyltransferase involved in cell wall biosynthesis
MSEPISILIPCFNAQEYLADALDSILRQTYEHLQIIVLDDGSTDQTLAILKEYSLFDKRIVVNSHSQNLGIIASRNTLLELCNTELAAWMDADDVASPIRIEKQVEFLTKHIDCVACTSHYFKLQDDSEVLVAVPPLYLSAEYMLFYNHILNPGCMFRMSVCLDNKIRFRTWISGASDYLFWVELSKFGEIGLIEEPLMTYRIHSTQETIAQKSRQTKGCLEVVKFQLKGIGCNVEVNDVAQMLVYPAETLCQKFTLAGLQNSAQIISQIRKSFPTICYDDELIGFLLLDMFRRQSRRLGIIGVFYFISLFGLWGLLKSRYFGLSLLWSATKTDWSRFVKMTKSDGV